MEQITRRETSDILVMYTRVSSFAFIIIRMILGGIDSEKSTKDTIPNVEIHVCIQNGTSHDPG